MKKKAAGHHLIFYSCFKYYHPEIIKFIEENGKVDFLIENMIGGASFVDGELLFHNEKELIVVEGFESCITLTEYVFVVLPSAARTLNMAECEELLKLIALSVPSPFWTLVSPLTVTFAPTGKEK